VNQESHGTAPACRVECQDNVTSDVVEKIFQEHQPQGGTNLVAVIQDAINHYFHTKATRQTNLLRETILVITDGEPDDRIAVADVILKATEKLVSNKELRICLIQVSNDLKVAKYLKSLDDMLQGMGAKFDIVNTISFDEMENMTLSEVLMNALAFSPG
jgi:uncharacterized protein YegL